MVEDQAGIVDDIRGAADGSAAAAVAHLERARADRRRAAIGVGAGKHHFARAVEQEDGIGVGEIVFDHPAEIQRVARAGGEGGGYAPRVHQHDIGREGIGHRAGAGQQPALKPEDGIIRRGHAGAKGAAGKVDGADIAGAVLGVPPSHAQRAAVIDIDRISEIGGEDGTVIPLKGERGPAVDRGSAVQDPIGKTAGVKHQSSAIDGRAARVGIRAGEGEGARAGFDQRIGAANYRADGDIVADVKRGAGRAEIDLPAGQGVARRAHRETGYSRRARDGDRANAGSAKEGGVGAGPGDVAAARGPVGRGGVPKEITGAIRPCERGGRRPGRRESQVGAEGEAQTVAGHHAAVVERARGKAGYGVCQAIGHVGGWQRHGQGGASVIGRGAVSEIRCGRPPIRIDLTVQRGAGGGDAGGRQRGGGRLRPNHCDGP